ncbi:peptidoglycan-binding protein [Streptomyces sp. NPDC051445]|uniref:peptidoglycan-binding protein n=1 Tax=Streptomyces sp. NPDC051445 TaxID=3365653 RepID=UPI00379DA9A6
MSEPQGGVCPLCGAPRASDGTPACACARLASDAHRSARTAEAAAAEDFDPVRIRPFVVLGDQDLAPRDGAGPGDPTLPAPAPAREPGEPPPAEEAAHQGPDPFDAPLPTRRRRRVHVLVLVGALAVAVTAAVFAGFLLYDGPARDDSPAGGVRAPVPDETSRRTTAAGGPSPAASRTWPSPTASSSPSPSSPTSPAPSRSTAPPSAPATGATGSASPRPGPSNSAPPVLRFGDTGPEVTELQLRLRQIGYYGGPAGGDYDRQVESAVRSYQLTRAVFQDDSGVYGTATRASLEAETDEP